jgi:hypothetical protein
MPVKFLTDWGVTRGEKIPLSLLFLCAQKNIVVKKIGTGSTTRKIKNPEWRTNAIYRILA